MTPTELARDLRHFEEQARPGEARTPRYRMRFHEWGDGPPLVIIHGLNDVPRSFVPLMAQLKKDFRCIAITLPEGGDDEARLHQYRHEHFPLDLAVLLDYLKLDRAGLLGSSFGSTIALRTATLIPDRIDRVILQGGFARRPLTPIERGLAHLGQSWPWRMGDLPLRPRIMRRLEAPSFAHAPQMIDFLMENSAMSPIRATTHRARILTTLDLRPLLTQIPHDVLMLGGDRDRIVPRVFESELETGLRTVNRIEFAPCGHYPQYTHPGEMAKSVRTFLAAASG